MYWGMSNQYSLDLRERAVSYVHEGGTRGDACRVFKIGGATLDRWLRRHREEGSLAPRARRPYRSKLDGEALHVYIAAHPDATLEEIGGAFAVYPSTIYYACRRLKITRKKNPAVQGAP